MSSLNRIFAFLVLAVVVSVGNARPPQKIIGGTSTGEGEFPYQVSLRLKGRHTCGGAIIDKSHIITAAHCVVGIVRKPYTNFTIMTGTHFNFGGQIHTVEAVHVHPLYVPLRQHDIAIVKIAEELKFDDNQDKINLPTEEPKSGLSTVASGWGLENPHYHKISTNLKKVTLYTLDHKECQMFAPKFKISPHQICTFNAPGLGVCVGDSGGPLAHNNTLIGIVSYGSPCALGVPDVFTNVYHYLDWIKEKCAAS